MADQSIGGRVIDLREGSLEVSILREDNAAPSASFVLDVAIDFATPKGDPT